jgi:hypothetical protein
LKITAAKVLTTLRPRSSSGNAERKIAGSVGATVVTTKISLHFFPSSEPVPAGGVSSQLGVFRRPRQARDKLTIEEGTTVSRFVQSRAKRQRASGDLLLNESRLLLENIGALGGTMHVVPTTTGWACIIPSAQLAAIQCANNFLREGIVLAASENVAGITLYGLARDDVTRVAVRLTHELREAYVANNGFFIELPHADAIKVEAIAVESEGEGRQDLSVSLGASTNLDL